MLHPGGAGIPNVTEGTLASAGQVEQLLEGAQPGGVRVDTDPSMLEWSSRVSGAVFALRLPPGVEAGNLDVVVDVPTEVPLHPGHAGT